MKSGEIEIYDISELQEIAISVRKCILTMAFDSNAPHIGSALSCVDILVSLYFRVAKINPHNPTWEDRDYIILSKGHAAAALYACLSKRGYFPESILKQYALDGSELAEHPSYCIERGIECSSGSLGHGLGIGIGMAYALQMDKRESSVYVILSDGECNEGSTWEAAIWAPLQKNLNITAIVDYNGFQASGKSTEITSIEPIADKWQSFGWDVSTVDGHNISQISSAIEKRRSIKPRAIIARTIKGKGVKFMENDLEWHYRSLSEKDFKRALSELEKSDS